MWIVAGVLIVLMLVALLAGFHTGPHTHVVAGVLGAVSAIWLVIMASEGRSLPLVIVLLVAVVLVSVGVTFLAWKGLEGQSALGAVRSGPAIEGASGKAVTDLDPEGVVRVSGEEWSATSLNGAVLAGDRIQVVNAKGVHLEVWGEEHAAPRRPQIPGTSSEGSSP
jgi:membrane-bound serine protease (ClpP class)